MQQISCLNTVEIHASTHLKDSQMLHELKKMESFTIGATDGTIGSVKDFYFDDESWVIRYLVVETGDWLKSRKVLITPFALLQPDWERNTLPAIISLAKVKNSPDIDTDKPVSRQHEMQYLGYYGYPYYWDGLGMLPGTMAPDMYLPTEANTAKERAAMKKASVAYHKKEKAAHRDDDPHLRSCEAVTGYHIHAIDGEIGHVHGYLIDDRSWAIRYVIVNTSNWWVGHKVLISPEWFQDIDWAEERVSVDLHRQSVEHAPDYDETMEFSRMHEKALYAHYKRIGYWPVEEAEEVAALHP